MALRLFDLAISDLMQGTARVQKVTLGTYQVWVNEIVVVLGARSAHTYLKSLFPADVWASPRRKRVVIPEGVEVGTASAFAIAVSEASEVQADSWGGDLILDIHGTVSGIGGAANSGTGGDAVRVNLLGRDGQELDINLYHTGTMRAGGGGGGKAGNGGAGRYNVRQPASGWTRTLGNYNHARYSEKDEDTKYSADLRWGTTLIWSSPKNTQNRHAPNPYTLDGWSYHWGNLYDTTTSNTGGSTPTSTVRNWYEVFRIQVAFTNTAGGIAGSAGRGEGFDGPATIGAAAVAGGTSAGASGKSGNGSPWGEPGQAGANGAAGNNGAGTAGAPGGLPGFALSGAANCNFNNLGTVLGRVA